jgi:hypothetical protein
MGPVTHDVNQGTVDSYRHIIAADDVAFYDFVRKTAGNPGPLHQAAETAAEDLKTEIIHIIETTHLPEAPARPSPDQTFASVQGRSTPATAAAAPAQCSTVGLTSARQHRFAQAATAACSAGTTRRQPRLLSLPQGQAAAPSSRPTLHLVQICYRGPAALRSMRA